MYKISPLKENYLEFLVTYFFLLLQMYNDYKLDFL